MRLTFVGPANIRRFTNADFPDHVAEGEDIEWTRGETREVSEEFGRWLTENKPKSFITPTESEMSRDELYSRAQELEIEGRSSMNKGELEQAVLEFDNNDEE